MGSVGLIRKHGVLMGVGQIQDTMTKVLLTPNNKSEYFW
jgi:hypothetical protein